MLATTLAFLSADDHEGLVMQVKKLGKGVTEWENNVG